MGAVILTVSKLQMYFGATLMFIALLVFLLQILSVLAVEVDMPWKNDLNEKYGESFRAWTEDDLSPAVRGVVALFHIIRWQQSYALFFLLISF